MAAIWLCNQGPIIGLKITLYKATKFKRPNLVYIKYIRSLGIYQNRNTANYNWLKFKD